MITIRHTDSKQRSSPHVVYLDSSLNNIPAASTAKPEKGVNFLKDSAVEDNAKYDEGKPVIETAHAEADSLDSKQARYKRHVVHGISHILGWLLISGVLILPVLTVWGYRSFVAVKGRVLGEATTALNSLSAFGGSLDAFEFDAAKTHLKEAHDAFAHINESLGMLSIVAEYIGLIYPKASSYYHLSQAGLHITAAHDSFGDVSMIFDDTKTVIERMGIMHDVVAATRPAVRTANGHIQQVRIEDFYESYRANLQTIKITLEQLSTFLEETESLIENTQTILGAHGSKRYALLFQNSGELRPTGGFIGSFAIVDIKDGMVQHIFMPGGGSYDLQGGLHQTFASPKPMQFLNPRWEMQDCNWFSDFRDSARACEWFIETSSGTSLDGVIAINVDVLTDVLTFVGSIDMPEYGVTITAENFIPFTQVTVENPDDLKQPKQFLVDMFPVIIERLFTKLHDPKNAVVLANLLMGSLDAKDIQLYMHDEAVQVWLEQRGFAGSIAAPENSDYLHVNVANVKGGKSDFIVSQNIEYDVSQRSDGSFSVRVMIERSHHGVSFDIPRTHDEALFKKLLTYPNISYIRLYVPGDAILVSVSGDIFDPAELIKERASDEVFGESPFISNSELRPILDEKTNTRITHEQGKTVFGNYLRVDPRSVKRIIFEYELPAFSQKPYQLVVQKQSGTRSHLTIRYKDTIIFDDMLDHDIVVSY